jgi:hypothetical protein
MPSGKITHDSGGTKEGTDACFDAIRKIIRINGSCSESEARGIALSMYPAPVLVRVGAQKLKNRKRGDGCRFAAEIDAFMSGKAVSQEAVEWFRHVGGNRQLTRLKQNAKAGVVNGVTYSPERKEFVPA